MYFKANTLALLTAFFVCPGITLAGDKGSSLLSLSSGIVTIDEFNGVSYSSFMAIPYGYSSAAFLTYRYFVTDRFAIGTTAGIDNVAGNLTIGDPGNNSTVGKYITHTFTVAAEALMKYAQRPHAMLYGYVGAGYTLSRVEKAYASEPYAAYYQNGVTISGGLPPWLSAQNPVYLTQNHFNAQLTALGIRYGGKIAWDVEFGVGYKGLINTGLSLKL